MVFLMTFTRYYIYVLINKFVISILLLTSNSFKGIKDTNQSSYEVNKKTKRKIENSVTKVWTDKEK